MTDMPDKQHIEALVRSAVLCGLANQQKYYIPAAIAFKNRSKERSFYQSRDFEPDSAGGYPAHDVFDSQGFAGDLACSSTAKRQGPSSSRGQIFAISEILFKIFA